MSDLICVCHEYDEDGNEIEESYAVQLNGKPADLYSISEDYFDSIVDAHSFAEEVSNETGVEITWGCIRPSWA